MKVNFNVPVRDLAGKPVMQYATLADVGVVMQQAGVPKTSVQTLLQAIDRVRNEHHVEDKELTVKTVVLNCLQGADNEASGAELVDRLSLALKIHDASDAIEIDEKNAETIRTLVKKFNPVPLHYFRVDEQLKGAAVGKEQAAGKKKP